MTGPVRYVTATVLRSRRRGLAVLVLVVALGGGAAMGAAAGARRAASADERLGAVSAVPDAFVLADSVARFDAVAALPDVEAASGVRQLGLQPASVPCDDENAHYFPVLMPAAGEPFATPRPRVVSGRLADPTDAGEVVLSEHHSRRLGVRVGDTVAYRSFHVDEEGSGSGCSEEVVAELEVVGVIRELSEIGALDEPTLANTWVTPAFGVEHPEVPDISFAAVIGYVDLAAGVSAAQFVEALPDRIAGGDTEAVLGLPNEDGNRLAPTLDAHALGLAALAAVVAVAALATFATGAARQVGALQDELRLVGALGCTRRQLAATAAAGGMVATLLGAALAGGVSVALSTVHLFGLAAIVEPDPGLDVDAPVLLIGVAAIVTLGLAISAVLAWRGASAAVTASGARSDHRRGLGDRLAAVGFSPPAAIGAGYALDGGSRPSLPSRAAVLGVGAATAALVAVLLFGAGVSRAGTDPAVYGWGTWDSWVDSDDDPSTPEIDPVEAFAGDDRVSSIARLQLRFKLPLAGEPRSGMAAEQLVGRSGPTVVRGRLPVGPSEIALGDDTARVLGVHVGGAVPAGGPDGTTDLHVVGIVAFPSVDGSTLSTGWIADRAAIDALGWGPGCNDESECFEAVAFDWRDGVDTQSITDSLAAAGLEADSAAPGAEVTLMAEVDRLPAIAAAAIAILAAVGLIHTIVVTMSRRRRDIATLRALGYLRRDVRRVLHAEGLTLGVVGGILGGLLGAMVGRFAWAAAARSIGIGPELPAGTTVVVTTLSITGVIVFAVLVSLVPAALATQDRAADGLRAES